MSAGRRMAVLEREAQHLLNTRGYEAVSVSDLFQNCRYIPYNLIGHRVREGGGDEMLIVKIKLALHKLGTIDAASFCRAEIVQLRKMLAALPPELEGARYECWISVPPDIFQQFAITGQGICEILPGEADDPAPENGGEACTK
ncbi:MAG: hypothetical protein WC379_17800 [Methanoregula sp.]|jgi:hypothetical protein